MQQPVALFLSDEQQHQQQQQQHSPTSKAHFLM
jgi:hypothetical protein